ncbi:hypothetical protein BC374_12305 [Ensifer sp. LC13]|nr:hypothetical protein BC362_02265 [Ensifer sp. LC14]OCP13723.1 hypothetical protein BC374_12305 [Ensifer sp. LC13]OCP14380.1 hypothetical protein BBX50_12585 [Ensifer sp. LC11]OCP29086.1 hypothetical protein BC364_10705 [Ensifer sp. LC499]
MQPRHVLCFLGQPGRFVELRRVIQSAIDGFAPGFEVDEMFSQDAPDDRMPASFDVCWDRVHPKAWTDEDEEAVREHGCVIYVPGPPMTAENAVETSAKALRLVVHTLGNGAVAAKGESAGVAHGLARWKQLGREADNHAEGVASARLCRLTFSKRPLSDGDFLFSVGFHLVGIPEVFVPRSLSDDERALSAIIDEVADEVFAEGVEVVLARRGAVLLPIDDYEEDDFKYNPHGAIRLKS